MADALQVCLRTIGVCVLAVGQQNVVPPDPIQWEHEPHSRTSNAVEMAARVVESAGGVEYRFECVAGPGHDSVWQDDPAYKDTDLPSETELTYVAMARDKATGQELAERSQPVTVTTRAAVQRADVESTHVQAIDKAIASGRLEVVPLMVNGDKDNRINIVVINRWKEGQRNAYNTADLRDEFIEDARHILGAFSRGNEEAIDPYPDYRDFFNVYAVWWPDIPPWNPEDRENAMHWADYNEIRARLFLPWRREGKGWVTHLAMFNGSGGGGGAGRRLDERVGDAMIVGNEISSFIHEFNHTAPGIPDEYTSAGMWGRGGEGATTTSEYRREFVKWRAWISPDTPVPTPYSPEFADRVGVFEGGVHRMAHLFRPTARGCLMGSGSFAGDPKQMCPVCRQRAVQRLYHWVDAIDETTPVRKELAIEGPTTLRFSVKRVAPDPDTQRTEWRLNGQAIAEGTDEVEVRFGKSTEYELTFALTDESVFIRPDPPYARFPTAEATWRITNRNGTQQPKPQAQPPRRTKPRSTPRTPPAPKPGFTLTGLRFEAGPGGTVRIANPEEGLRYLWYAGNLPEHLPRFPHGLYAGTYTNAAGEVCEADAYVVQNKGGMYVDERAEKNDFGHWIHLMAHVAGRSEEPLLIDVDTQQDGRLATELSAVSHEHNGTTWDGQVADGALHLVGEGPEGGVFDMRFVSQPPPEKPLHTGLQYRPPESGNYYVGARNTKTGAASVNRVGVAVTVGPALQEREPVKPDEVTSAGLLLWLDASDMDGDGEEDDPGPRRGAVLGWQDKAGNSDFKDFIYYQPNQQNGKGVASWETIWIQNLAEPVSGYQTIFMVRREHQYSSAGTAPWRDLSGLIGVGEYGGNLMSDEVGEDLRSGTCYLNGEKVAPLDTPMPTGFYQVTYEFGQPIDQGFRTTDGHYEGSVAECAVYDGKLTEADREGVEEYLRRKWLSAVHIVR